MDKLRMRCWIFYCRWIQPYPKTMDVDSLPFVHSLCRLIVARPRVNWDKPHHRGKSANFLTMGYWVAVGGFIVLHNEPMLFMVGVTGGLMCLYLVYIHIVYSRVRQFHEFIYRLLQDVNFLLRAKLYCENEESFRAQSSEGYCRVFAMLVGELTVELKSTLAHVTQGQKRADNH